jgi:hypothetical protein
MSYREQNLEQKEQRRDRGIGTLNRNKDETQRTEPCRAKKEQNIGETGNKALNNKNCQENEAWKRTEKR